MPSYSSLAQQEALAKQLAITQQAHDQLIASSTIMHDDEDVIPLEERIAQRQREQAEWEHAIGVQQQETQQAMLGQLQTLMQSLDGGATVDDDTEMEQGTIYKPIPQEVPQFIYHDSGDEIPPMSNSPSLGSVAPPSEPQLMTQCPSCGVPNYQFAYDQLFHAHVGSCYINKHVKTPMHKPMPVPQQPKQMLNQIRDAVAKLDEQQRTSLMDAFKKLSGAGQNSNQQSIAHVLSMLYTPATKPQSPMNSPSHFSLEKSAAQQPTRTHAMPPPPPPQYLDPQFYAMQQHHHHQLDNSHQSAPTEEESYEYGYEQEQTSEAPQQAAAPVDPAAAAAGERPFWEDDVIPPEEREYQRQLHESYLAQQAAYYREQQEIYEQNQRQNAEVYGQDYEQHYPAPHQYAEYYGHHHHHHHHQHHHQPQHQHHPAYQYHQYAPDYSQDYSPESMDSPEYSGSW